MEYQISDFVEKLLAQSLNAHEVVRELESILPVILRNKYPYMPFIVEEEQKEDNGEVHITIRKYQGKVTDVVTHSIKRIQLGK